MKKKTFQNWRKVDVKNFCARLKLDELYYECEKLAEFVDLYNDKITSGLNLLTTTKKVTTVLRDKQPWYADKLWNQKISEKERAYEENTKTSIIGKHSEWNNLSTIECCMQ